MKEKSVFDKGILVNNDGIHVHVERIHSWRVTVTCKGLFYKK